MRLRNLNNSFSLLRCLFIMILKKTSSWPVMHLAFGAVLSHRMVDGKERPISFMSITLTPAERNYSHLDKEGLTVIFGIKLFHKYLFSRKFTICTDHKSLLSLFSERKAVPQIVLPRIQRVGSYDAGL